ncbi:MAG: hypothetical protein Fur0032_15450 [Terrimicrobiaceae bacterium]
MTAIVLLTLSIVTHVFAQPGPVNVLAPTPPPAPIVKPRPFSVHTDYGEGNAIANALRDSPPRLYTFDRASLRDVLRFLAQDAGIPFVSMQERAPSQPGSPGAGLDDILVTFTMRASPFLVLESIAKANDIALVYEQGVWFIRPYNEQELLGRIYRLKFTPQDRVGYVTTGGAGGNQQQNSTQNQASVPTAQVQQPQFVFKMEEPMIVKEIKNMLRIPSTGVSGKVAPNEASVEDFPPLPANTGLNPAGSSLNNRPPAEMPAEPSVTFNSDTSTLYVVATRQQHQWVEGFLSAADRPQDLIGIEVKFIETRRDPRKDLGINWANTFGGEGYVIRAGAEAEMTGGLNSTTLSEGLDAIGTLGDPAGLPTYSRTTTDVNGATTTTQIDRRNRSLGSSFGYERQTSFEGGYSAFLSPAEVNFAIQAFVEDRDSSIVQYPRVLTVNNREVAISNTRNEPIIGQVQLATVNNNTVPIGETAYLPIGTQVNILPKTMPDGSVLMNVSITISNIIGFKNLENFPGIQNEYPITAARIYQSALQVNSSYTLAVGGLDESFDEMRADGIPGLKDIPGLGYLFKSKGREQNRRNLIVFITPSVIKDRSRTTGISESPESVIPVRPGDPGPPAFGTDGRLVGGIDGLNEAFAWLAQQNDLYAQINRENRANRESIKQLEGVIRTAEMILAEIEILDAKFPNRAVELAEKEESATSLLNKLRETLRKTRKNLF